jgi:hypothetical protein
MMIGEYVEKVVCGFLPLVQGEAGGVMLRIYSSLNITPPVPLLP